MICGLLLLAGCQWGRPPAQLPSSDRIDLDRIVLHSDFKMPRRHALLGELNAMRVDLARQLDVAPAEETIHVYLFDDAEIYQRYLRENHPEFPHRRAFFVRRDATFTVYAHWSERIDEDLRHEITHGYLHAAVPNIPLWLDEGIAENMELGAGQLGVHDAHIDLLLRRWDEGTWRPDLQRLEAIEHAGAMLQIDYAESWLWAHWLMHTTPERLDLLREHLVELRTAFPAVPLSQRISERFGSGERSVLQHLTSTLGR